MGKFATVLCVALAVAACSAYEEQGSKLFRVEQNPNADLQREIVAKLDTLQEKFNIDFWLEPRFIGPTDFLVTPAQHEFVTSYLQSHGIRHRVLMEDVGAVLEEQRLAAAILPKQNEMSWDRYHRADVIHRFVDTMGERFPSLATVQSIGTSTEGRDLKLIKIGRPKPGVVKPAFWIDGGIHAREWISPAITTYFINQLLMNQTVNEDILDNIDFYIIPVANVDGYEFTHTNTRMWRKTRSNHNSPVNCIGVDPNRNFGTAFGGIGSSNDKCSDIYRGPEAFSEPETNAMRNFIETARDSGVDWKSYYAIHSYAQMWLTPWGYTYDLPEDFDELYDFGMRGSNALTAVHGTPYIVGSITQVLSPGAGGSDDWAKGSGIFKFSQTIEVRDTGRYGFALPPDQIIPTGQETWAAIQTNAREFITKH